MSQSTRNQVPITTQRKFFITLPHFSEQQKIASFLTSVDDKIQQLTKKKALLEAYKKGLMQSLFSQQLRFKDDEGADYPDWEEKTLGDVSEGIMYGMNSSAIEYDGVNKYIRITDIDESSRQFIPNPLTSPDGKLEDKYRVKEGDILFARTGASVGKSYLYNKKDGNLFFAGFLIKFSIKNANPHFVFLQTLKDEYWSWVKMVSMRSGQPGINAEEYKSLMLVLPCLEEQQKIANILTSIDNKINLVATQVEKATAFKKGLLQQLFI